MLCGTVRREEHSLWESPIQVSKTSNVYNIDYRIIIKILINNNIEMYVFTSNYW